MASINSTPVAKSDYQYTGIVTPISALTNDSRILGMAERLHEQGRRMADAQLRGIEFAYRPICIPGNLRHIFG